MVGKIKKTIEKCVCDPKININRNGDISKHIYLYERLRGMTRMLFEFLNSNNN